MVTKTSSTIRLTIEFTKGGEDLEVRKKRDQMQVDGSLRQTLFVILFFSAGSQATSRDQHHHHLAAEADVVQ